MASYRIVCTEQEPAGKPPEHAHIIAVGIGNDSQRASKRLNLEEVLRLMENGDNFYTKGDKSGKIANVEKFLCPFCVKWHIRSEPDNTEDNNLDKLRYCRSWNS